jgi:hypothetical protein|nr:MAG TPA: hypothetical protein [Caudoviricetes sp.]
MSYQLMKIEGENNNGHRHVWIKPSNDNIEAIVNRIIEQKKTEIINTVLPIGSVILTYFNYNVGKEQLGRRARDPEINRRIANHIAEMKRKGFIPLDYYYSGRNQQRTTLNRSEYPELMQHANDNGFLGEMVSLNGASYYNFTTNLDYENNNKLNMMAWLYVGRPVGRLNTDGL